MPEIFHWMDKKKILIIKGSRQVGKTTLLQIIKEKLEREGKRTFYLSVDRELGNPFLQSSKHLLRFLEDQFSDLGNGKKLYLFLDEFQYLENSGLFLKTLFDASQDFIQIIVSGSSSLEITKNVEFLTGRKIEFYLYPLYYREFLAYKTKLKLPQTMSIRNFKQIKEFYEVYQREISEWLLDYCSFGGYPEVVMTKAKSDKIIVLKELVRTYIEKDIIAFLRLENITAFNSLLRVLGSQIGNLVNRSELSNTIDLNMETLRKYLDILEGTYLVEFVRPYFTNLRKQLSKMPKVYLNDFGVKNVVLNSALPINCLSGAERENFVYNVLKQRYGKGRIKFFRTISKAEIDFVVELPGRLIPVEVKSVKKAVRPPKVMKSFMKDYGVIVTDNFLDKKGDIYFIPIVLLPFIEFK